jgi:hypothetical protein
METNWAALSHRKRILKAFEMFTAHWPKYEYTDETTRLYGRLLMDLPPDVLEAAVVDCLATCTFFPTIDEIRKRAARLLLGDRPTALEAWGEVMGKMHHTQYYYRDGRLVRRPDKLDDLSERAIEAIGGWQYVRMSENAMADRARFCEVYEALERRRREDAMMLPEVRAVAERLRLEGAKEAPALPPGR